MILEATVRVWMKCQHCGHYLMWESDDRNVLIGAIEMHTPDYLIDKLATLGWLIDEEGLAKHLDPEVCKANVAKIERKG